jgi:hypothetical protein
VVLDGQHAFGLPRFSFEAPQISVAKEEGLARVKGEAGFAGRIRVNNRQVMLRYPISVQLPTGAYKKQL